MKDRRSLDKKYLLTGLPGSGKSTVIMRCVGLLRMEGLRVGGISTPELREKGRRIGFKVVDLASGREALMAGVNIPSIHRVGRYGVDIAAFESVALPALDDAEKRFDVVVIDEIGRMEFYSTMFRRRIIELLKGPITLIAAVHRDYADLYGKYGTLLWISQENRDELPMSLASQVLRSPLR
ncbi:MAG: NTPase [Candidatus Bathyarchaeia archaeon]